MKPQSVALLATVVSLFTFSSVAMSGVREERPNLVGGELLGRGLALTLNYERFMTNQVGLGFGLMAFKSGGAGIAIVPVYLSFVPGDVHSPYLSLGGTLLAGGGDLQDWEHTVLFTASVGYQYQSSGGFFVRPIFSYLRPTEPGSGDSYLIWPGLTIGGSF